MNGCDEGIDGLTGNNVTLNTPTINNPAIEGGELHRTVIGEDCAGNPVLAGVTAIASCTDLQEAIVTISDVSVTAAHELRIIMSDGRVISVPLPQTTPETLAATFQTCAGNPHNPDALIPTCDEMAAAITQAVDSIRRIMDISVSSDNELRIVLSDGTVLTAALPQISPDTLAATFMTCAGNPHVAGATLPTCTEVDAAIAEAISEAQHNLTPSGANPPDTSEAPELPTTLYGERLALLGKPMGWVIIGGYLIPHYGVIECP